MYLKKGTHTIEFGHPLPERVTIFVRGLIWIDRDLNGKFQTIKFNAIFPGDYTSKTPFKLVKSEPLKIENSPIQLYHKERHRQRPCEIVYNHNLGLTDTPARIFTQMNPARIEIGQRFKKYPPQVRMFILLHEYGHLFYKDEHKTDLFALKCYLNLGLNASQAFYALSKVLHPSPDNTKRIKQLFQQLKNNGYVKANN